METTFNSTLMPLPIEQIHLSKTNPRKTFDERALAELTESVKQYGIFQPVLVRPKNGSFELVCGERRYRAATAAQLEEIPANIRDLTDDEAFELQIIENLERKDVHPLEEAEAFQKMIETGRYQIHDIAAKTAKPESFIHQRLKLNDLVPELKQDFLHNELSIGHAVQIARLNEESQYGIYKFYKNRYDVSGYGTVKQLTKEIDNKSKDLTRALFPLDKDFSYAKACVGCSFRSTSNPMLFADMTGDNCLNKVCFDSKTIEHNENTVQSVLATNKNIPLAKVYGDIPKGTAEIINKVSAPVLKIHDDFYTGQRPGTVKKKVLYVNGEDVGKIKSVWVYENKAAAIAKAPEDLEIEKIETRAKRMLELDEEKIHAAIIEALRPVTEKNPSNEFTLTMAYVEAIFLFVAIEKFNWWVMGDILEKLGIKIDVNKMTLDNIIKVLQELTAPQKLRLAVYMMFRTGSGSTTRKSIYGQMIRKLGDSNKFIPVAKIEADQKKTADDRIAKTNSRLSSLKKALKQPEANKESK